jgi:flagellar basal body-associated protein FliL
MNTSKTNFLIAREIIVIFKLLLISIAITGVSIFFTSRKEIETYQLKKEYETAKQTNQNLTPIENKITELYRPYCDQEGEVITPSGRKLFMTSAKSSDGCVYLRFKSESSLEQIVNYDCLLSRGESVFSTEKKKEYLKVFFFALLTLFAIRYMIKMVKWVKKNSKEPVPEI